ncbi:erythromycin esterase family protein [Streptomyces sp. SID4919]|uniref:erythromycin esterase family protein n=1 Tax=unclassified Streptomyces TaxID=2593676 RepID=UPI000823CEB9|nr:MULTISPECIES: erythromycin esterase family protein [unclassified Streptomyces]MYY09529.1 erythromycin esterase family protein [Streptomyces sp. SID4919]SCK62981.1 erythromycin esterase [Streptomyces sp. AmelKG-E11A]
MSETVTEWIGQHAHRLTTLDSRAPLTDLLPIADIVRDARVVAVGAATRQAHELSALSHRIVRLLVEELGFRSLALEGDDPSRLGLDEYIRTGTGDPRVMLSEARSFWQTEEILDVIHWMRSFNRRHPDDPVRFAGPARPPQGQASPLNGLAGIERNLAEGTIQWHEDTSDRIVYWGGIAHTVNGDPRTVSPSSPPMTHRNAGSYLREHFGAGYVSLGLTFHHGTAPYRILPPPAEFADAVLGGTGLDAYLLDLRADGPPSVRTWLDTPTRTRLIGPDYEPDDDAAYHLSGGSLADWFDAILHTQEVTPVRALS